MNSKPTLLIATFGLLSGAILAHAEPSTIIYGADSDKKQPVKSTGSSLVRSSAPPIITDKKASTPIKKSSTSTEKKTSPGSMVSTEAPEPGRRDPSQSFYNILGRQPTYTGKAGQDGKDLKPSNFPWKKNIVTTTFWIGQGASGYNSTMNKASAWDQQWKSSYGGVDTPDRRDGGILPANFAAMQNPFYIALPFNDVKYPKIAAKWVPWWDKEFAKNNRWTSQVKGRWVQIRCENGKICYAQWEDVGPFRYDHAEYIFGRERPTTYNKAGLDISPAVKEYLNLTGLDVCDWRFVEAHEVPDGPWLKYGEQAIIFAALQRVRAQEKAEAKKKKKAAKPKK